MILDEIAAYTRGRVTAAKQAVSLDAIRARAEAMPRDGTFPFEAALGGPGLSFICEVKKASPSKGIISADFPYLDIAQDYERGGAAALSVLTEPKYFLGRDEYLREIAEAVPLPVLRKDFVVDAYQIYGAKLLGASAVLLIAALLDKATLERYIELAHSLGLSALAEAHTEAELLAVLAAGARLVGVNNRDLRTFAVNFSTGARLRALVPPEVLFVAESGVTSPADVRALRAIGADAALVGEALMRAPDRVRFLGELREAGHAQN
ncbi:MAG: indole-3-glycerol phosphate synthase TrpC [Oscillospiraceae bacterium]|jgi:indole-3-glycerol phosphate synthase|nr:indole-3-glycerol phosphate synthase TrpC [Oscillospiraceae bacterium]